MADIDGDDFGGPVLGFASSTVVNVTLARADIYAADLVWLQFSHDMVRDDALLDPGSYVITGPGVTPVTVVSSGTDADSSVNEVFLVVRGFEVGEEYTITVPGALRSIYGSIIKPGASAKFIARRTAIDSIISSLPKALNTMPGSRIRGLINAIGRQIDLTKGARRDYLP